MKIFLTDTHTRGPFYIPRIVAQSYICAVGFLYIFFPRCEKCEKLVFVMCVEFFFMILHILRVCFWRGAGVWC